jgi:hypothetical protein
MRTRPVAVLLCVLLAMAVVNAAPSAAAPSHGWRTTLHFKWHGYHRFSTTTLTLRPDGTVHAGPDRGTWRVDRPSHRIVLRFSTGCDPVYRGTTHSKTAAGTMRCGRYQGKWFMDRLRPVHRRDG